MPPTDERPRLISLVGKSRMKQILACMLDESEFLSCYGLRLLSRYHREHPLILNMDGHVAVSTMSRVNLRKDSVWRHRTGDGLVPPIFSQRSLRHPAYQLGRLTNADNRQNEASLDKRPSASADYSTPERRGPATMPINRFRRGWRDGLPSTSIFMAIPAGPALASDQLTTLAGALVANGVAE
jgi:hypothetical protein